jgi:hypothetical protein
MDDDFDPAEIYQPIRTELQAELDAGEDGSLHTDEAMELLCAMVTGLARDVEIFFSEYSSERGRDGESHSLWKKPAFPFFHERVDESKEQSESGDFLVRVTTTSEYRCRTVVVGRDERFYIIYWSGSSRTTEHGSERSFRAVAVQRIEREEIAALVGVERLARALAGLVVDRFADDWKPASTVHLEPRPLRCGGHDERALFLLQFPPADSCMALDQAGRLIWVAKPACGMRRDDYGAEAFEPEPSGDGEERDEDHGEGNCEENPDLLMMPDPNAHESAPLERAELDLVDAAPEGW